MKRNFADRAGRLAQSDIREIMKLLDEPNLISFGGGVPDPDLFPKEAFAQALSDAALNDPEALQYQRTEGFAPLVDWLVAHMESLGIPCEPENILVTTGSQQALEHIGKLYLSPADTVLINGPTYLGALSAFSSYESEFDQLNLTGNRDAQAYVDTAAHVGGAVKLTYVTPDFSNPTGETIDQAGRETLIALCDEIGCGLVEDAAYQALRYEGAPVPPILALEYAAKGDLEACRTIYCGSFSKTLSPGLRVGWVCAPKDLIERLVLIKQAGDLQAGSVNQIAIHTVAVAQFDDHVAMLRRVYTKRRDAMLAALGRYMPEGASWSRPEGGMFIWVTLPSALDSKALLETAIFKRGVAYIPGGAFMVDGTPRNSIRLSFSLADEAQIDEGIKRLGQLFQEALEA